MDWGWDAVDNQVMYAVAGDSSLQRKLELRNEHQRTKFFGNDIRLDCNARKVESERLTIRKSWMPSAVRRFQIATNFSGNSCCPSGDRVLVSTKKIGD